MYLPLGPCSLIGGPFKSSKIFVFGAFRSFLKIFIYVTFSKSFRLKMKMRLGENVLTTRVV